MSNKEEEKKEISLSKKIIRSIGITLESSSIHAIPNIVRSDYISLKTLWLLCLLSSASGCVFFMRQAILDYLSWPVVTNIEVTSPNGLV